MNSNLKNLKINENGTAEFISSPEEFLSKVKNEARSVIDELLSIVKINKGEIIVIGCSTSEITGNRLGKASIPSVADAALEGIYNALEGKEIFLAAQCCEHLNRALIIERECAEKYGYDIVSVRPQPKAGGAFATAVYDSMKNPVAVEHIKAHAGIDIGGTLIGMHLHHVAVPLRLSVSKIGEAPIICAYTRPKYIGGPRACYQ